MVITSIYLQDFNSNMTDLMRIADIGILLGSDVFSIQKLQDILAQLPSMQKNSLCNDSLNIKKRKRRIRRDSITNIALSQLDRTYTTIPYNRRLSVYLFFEGYLLNSIPCVLSGCIDDWPALKNGGERAWSNLSYIIQGIHPFILLYYTDLLKSFRSSHSSY